MIIARCTCTIGKQAKTLRCILVYCYCLTVRKTSCLAIHGIHVLQYLY
jgi:hypothetical protein